MCCIGIAGDGNTTVHEENGESKPVKRKRKLKRVVTSVEDTGDRISYWIPRIHLLFLAEDPQVFANRVVQAIQDRRLTEAHLR